MLNLPNPNDSTGSPSLQMLEDFLFFDYALNFFSKRPVRGQICTNEYGFYHIPVDLNMI